LINCLIRAEKYKILKHGFIVLKFLALKLYNNSHVFSSLSLYESGQIRNPADWLLQQFLEVYDSPVILTDKAETIQKQFFNDLLKRGWIEP